MRISDLWKLSFRNLARRRTRTMLTVLGVVIGTASIVVMVSLGLGMSDSLLKSYQNSASLTKITVMNPGGGGDGKNKLELTDERIKDFEALPHVTGTSPALSVFVEMKSGAYTSSANLVGVSQEYLHQLSVGRGALPAAGDLEPTLFYGNQVGTDFYKNGNWNMPGNIDPMKDKIFFTFPEGYQSRQESNENGTQNKKYIFKTAGVLAGGEEEYTENSFYIYTDIDVLKHFLRKIYKKNLVPNPVLQKNGKPVRYYVYNEAYVFCDDMEHVTEVQQMITDQGFQCYSNMEWLKQGQEMLSVVQLVLGGIGAVSLLVAAIGIMNTMMMSIYERTREIGVMKVLGCDMKDIRNMFLSESAMIGFLGGIAGLLLSFGISFLINRFAGGGDMLFFSVGEGAGISLIPLWLSGFSVVFATLVGTLSGLVPALRAMRLSPLQAIATN